jgi:hypothetical protein
MRRLRFVFLLATAPLAAPLAAAAAERWASVDARTEATPNLKRGSLRVRARRLSGRRLAVRVRFRVEVNKPTEVTVFLNPCRPRRACQTRPRYSRTLKLSGGNEDKSFRITVTRRGRAIRRPCVGFNAADQNPSGRRAYNIGPKSQPVVCPPRR